jgi:hypothetical protein
MLITDRILFIHPPKMAGMAITRFLVENLPGSKMLTIPLHHAQDLGGVQIVEGIRHETLAQGSQILTQLDRPLHSFDAILSVVRNPYDLEVSRFHYLRLDNPWDRGRDKEIALTGDFAWFCKEAPYFGNLPSRIETWYTLDGVMPANMHVLRVETLGQSLPAFLKDFCTIRYPLTRENATRHRPFPYYLTPFTENAIYEKYRWLFRYYPRLVF